MKDYHAILGIPKDASMKKIKKAYIDNIKFIHPDKYEMYSLEWENANKRLSEINEAYTYLKNPENRLKQPRTRTTRKQERGREAYSGPLFTHPAAEPQNNTVAVGDLPALILSDAKRVMRGVVTMYREVVSDIQFYYLLIASTCCCLLIFVALYLGGLSIDQVGARFAFAQKAFAEQPAPRNGIQWSTLDHPGTSELEISTQTARDNSKGFYLVKVVEKPGKKAMTVFLHAGERAKVQLPEAEYEIRYAYGEKWYGLDNLFGPGTVYGKLNKSFHFYNSGEKATRFSIRLYPNHLTKASVIEVSSSSIETLKVAPPEF